MSSPHHDAVHREHGGAFGTGGFGAFAEALARFFGTPQYLITQTLLVLVWIGLNGYGLIVGFDPYPFILLNLAFSLQAAYAAPLILLAQSRQAARDRAYSDADAHHREAISNGQTTLLVENTRLTEEVHRLTLEVHRLTVEVHHHLTQNANGWGPTDPARLGPATHAVAQPRPGMSCDPLMIDG